MRTTSIYRQDQQMHVRSERFDNIFEFSDAIEHRELNAVFADQADQLSSRRTENWAWYGTRNWDEASTLLRIGYTEVMSTLTRNVKRVVDETPKPRFQESIIGDFPQVANFVKGIPTDMIFRKRIKIETPQVAIYYDRSASCKVTPEEVCNTARKVLEIVRHFEARNIRVQLNIMECSYSGHETCCLVINLKQYNSPLNILKISYPMCHTSFFRRHIFAWQETSPIITDRGYKSTYGYPLYTKFQKSISAADDFLKECNVIPQNGVYLNHQFMVQFTNDVIISHIEKRVANFNNNKH